MTWFDAYNVLGTKQKKALRENFCQLAGCTFKTFYLKMQNEHLFNAIELRTLWRLYCEQATLNVYLIDKVLTSKIGSDDNTAN